MKTSEVNEIWEAYKYGLEEGLVNENWGWEEIKAWFYKNIYGVEV